MLSSLLQVASTLRLTLGRRADILLPETVLRWHREGYRRYWRRRSAYVGRPRIPREHIRFIKRISTDHSEWGEDRIALELRLKLGIEHSRLLGRAGTEREQYPACSERGGCSSVGHDGDLHRQYVRRIVSIDTELKQRRASPPLPKAFPV